MMVFPLFLMFINICSVCCLKTTLPKSRFNINTAFRVKPAYVTALEESTEKLESKQDEFDIEMKNVSARVDDLSGRLDTTQTSCTCKQEIDQAASVNVEHEKALTRLEEQIAELNESMLVLANTNTATSRESSAVVQRLEDTVNDLSMKSQDAQNKIVDLTESTAKLTEFVNRVLYKVTMFIGEEDHGSSDNRVSLRMIGSSKTYNIHDINDQGRGTGQVNEVFFHSASLGSLQSVYMELHGTDGLYIEKLTIDELYSGRVSVFNYDAWIDDTDGPQNVTLSPTSTYSHT